MSNAFTYLPKIAIIAHRGASKYAPENTLSAFYKAVEFKADAVEFDVCLSKDNEVLVIHGPSVDRTTNGHGLVKSLSLKEIKKLDAGSHFHPSFLNEKIPTLEEVFESLGKKTIFNIELKDYLNLSGLLPLKVANLIKRYQLENRAFISSFNPFVLAQLQHHLPNIAVSILALKGRKGFLSRWLIPHIMKVQGIHPYFEDISSSYLKHFNRQGLRIHVYTINLPEQIKHFIGLGVEGIITDDPLNANKIRSEIHGNNCY